MFGIIPLNRKNSLLRWTLTGALITLLALAGAPQADAAPAESIRALLLFNPAAAQTEAVPPAIAAAGGHVTHLFPGTGLIATLPSAAQETVAGLPAVADLFTQPVDLAQVAVYGPAAQQVAGVWNSLLAPPPPADDLTIAADHPEEHRDLLFAPDAPANDDLTLSDVSVRPGYYQTSAFMAGSVAVGLVLLESDGSIDPSTENWTPDEKQHVFNEIVNATNWWSQLEPRANLTFVYDDHYTNPLPTGVEPITHPTFDYTGYGESKWVGDAMGALGYTASSYFTRVRDYNNDLRDSYHTDWAFTIFVVDSSVDSDNRFADGYFAYAYLGGPFMVMTYGNNGYGPNNMDAVAAHEIGHIFNALDQYYSAGQSCTLKSGYLNVQNQNSQYGGCSSNVNSIMRGQIYPYTSRAIDAYAAGQIGWRDSDGDNILDPLDTPLPISLTSATVNGNTLTVSGQAEITPYPAPLQPDVTINNLTTVQYRVDGQSWQPANLPGDFGDAFSSFEFAIDALPAGAHTLEVVAADSAGNISASAAATQFVIETELDGGLNTELYQPAGDLETSQSLVISGLAYHSKEDARVTAVEYRLNGGAWQPAIALDGAFNSNYEPFTISLDMLAQSGDSLLLEARAADDTGYQEQTPASQELLLGGDAGQQHQVFVPMVVR